MAETDSLLTTRQLQDLLQVDRITVYRMLNDGRLQGFKVGGQWRFSRQAIDQWLREQQSDLEVPEAPRDDDDLLPSSEVLPLSCVGAIQDVFARALTTGTVTTAVDGTPITTVSHSCDFCDLILASPAGRQRCMATWRRSIAEQRNTFLPTACHAGLQYVSARIHVQRQLVGAIHAGQFLGAQPDGETWAARIADLAAATGASEQKLHRALSCVPVLSQARQQHIADLLQRVANTFSEIGEERLNLLGRLQRIAEISNV